MYLILSVIQYFPLRPKGRYNQIYSSFYLTAFTQQKGRFRQMYLASLLSVKTYFF